MPTEEDGVKAELAETSFGHTRCDIGTGGRLPGRSGATTSGGVVSSAEVDDGTAEQSPVLGSLPTISFVEDVDRAS